MKASVVLVTEQGDFLNEHGNKEKHELHGIQSASRDGETKTVTCGQANDQKREA